ncbi:hypothetical protein OKA05_20555 [Luteolibacter arcticus]|uniref:Uncharacterized protein n=1 Tax=Luteolibacter arcticus TaxID=1581411 RepID=A0ABT3GN70_9BACT|nr:hypothetical protein [Luteolibacter arcticus]MCW1924966.1 hypothetical protein [Luteolibacter arcticus]
MFTKFSIGWFGVRSSRRGEGLLAAVVGPHWVVSGEGKKPEAARVSLVDELAASGHSPTAKFAFVFHGRDIGFADTLIQPAAGPALRHFDAEIDGLKSENRDDKPVKFK